MCSKRDFYFEGTENGSARAHSAHILPLVRCRHSVLPNTDRGLSNNQIENELKGIQKVL